MSGLAFIAALIIAAGAAETMCDSIFAAVVAAASLAVMAISVERIRREI